MSNTQNNIYFSSIIQSLELWEKNHDAECPNNPFQNGLETFGKAVKNDCDPLIQKFNNWLEENHATNVNEELINYLTKLPFRSAQNVLSSLYSVISSALYLAIQPRKGMCHLVKSTIDLFNELTKPEVWSVLGASSIAMMVGQSLIMSTPLSLIGLMIGGALAVAGVSTEAYVAALNTEKGKESIAIREKLGSYLQKLPEVVLTGFFNGLLMGGIRRALSSAPSPSADVLDHYEKIEGVAQYGGGDWSKLVKIVRGISLEEAKSIADSNKDITYFFHTKKGMDIGQSFAPGDTAFFSGSPWWGSAHGQADGYIKI